MTSHESRSTASPTAARRIRSSKRNAQPSAVKHVRSSSTALRGVGALSNGQSSHRANASLRVKPRRFRVRRLLRSTVLMGVGVLIGACSIWHPHAVAGGAEGRHASAGTVQTKVFNPATFPGTPGKAQHIAGLWTAVEPGDTVWSLADRYGSPDRPIRDTVEDILRWNHLHEDASLRVGQSIQVAE
ncbi:MAG: LysM peptidoglycan-binding domain-containing protein [Armatimonadota bacterium]|nr:LysM peptidoglycan-binding domain-containing protein [Armatimonadota bacterium]